MRTGIEYFDVAFGIFVHQRRAVLQSKGWLQRSRQHLIKHLDQARSLARNGFGISRHCRHDFTAIAHLAQGHSWLVFDEGTHAVGRVQVHSGDDGAHTGQRLGGAQVVTLDQCMRVRALQERAVQHAWPVHIGDVLGLAGEFFVTVERGDRLPHCALGQRIELLGYGVHGASSCVRKCAAACRTAATMGA